MSSRSALRLNWLVFRPASGRAVRLLVVVMFAFCVASMVSPTQSAEAAYYRMVLCGANNGSYSVDFATNTSGAGGPTTGIFSFQTGCAASSPYPAGNSTFLRIADNRASGFAGQGNWASIYWTATANVGIAAAGGYTREPNAFNEGWRGFLWVEGYDGSHNNILVQGSGVVNNSCGGVCWATTPVFAPHLWPFGGYGNYRRFFFELQCVRPSGCDMANFNAVDANSFQLVLNDQSPPSIAFTGSTPFMTGQWVRGDQIAPWNVSEQGSGLRWEILRIDGTQRNQIDHRSACDIDSHGATGEFARQFRPCPTGGPFAHSSPVGTAVLADGAHTLQVCAQDYGQNVGLNGSGGESCDQRLIRVDNKAPAAPGGLAIVTPNSARYLDQFGAKWTLFSDPGSPVTKVHYNVVDHEGNVVSPEQVVTGTNPIKLDAITSPKASGDYRLRVWLEDQVGLVSPAATVPIPHDTTPPAAPQDVSVTVPTTSRVTDGFDVRWRNIVDSGSPISVVRYQVLNGAGAVVVPTQTLGGDNPQSISDLLTPSERGAFELRLWLSDAEGNVGAPASVPLAYRCVRSDVGGGSQLNAQVDGMEGRVVSQGEGGALSGALRGPSGAVANAPLCIFSNVVTDVERDFLGLAITAKDGGYRFGIAPGPSRNILAIYRSDHREIKADAKIETVVHPTFYAKKRVVRNKQFGRFYGEIPGPHNDRVVVVLQARRGKGWIAFRRYRTRGGGKFNLIYRFHNTTRPTKYVMRAQVRQTTGYPYLQGNSDRLVLKVMPARRVAVPRPGR